MNRTFALLFFMTAFCACHNRDAEMQQQQLIKSLKNVDSELGLKTQSQDSALTGYIQSFNEIQDNLDSIKRKEKIITLSTNSDESNDKKGVIISDLHFIKATMHKNDMLLLDLEDKLKTSGMKNAELQKMIGHLTEELTEKDAEIASLQSNLAELNAAYKDIVNKLNDTVDVIKRKNVQIAQQNTIYYAVGTSKELKKNGIIKKQGGVLGVGSIEAIKTNVNTSYFTSADMANLHSVPLYGKMRKILTTHPTGSYTVHGDTKADSLIIMDPKTFWSESRYLVVIIK